jgi:hypothetical protein
MGLFLDSADTNNGHEVMMYNGATVYLVNPSNGSINMGGTNGSVLTLTNSQTQFLLSAVATSGYTISSTGGTKPTCSCTGGSPTCSTATGSTNNRGQINMAAGTGVTTCTLTFNSSTAFPQAPFCGFFDGNASITPLAYSAGATNTTSAVVDFAAATSANINYHCM